eukprot:4857751-Amphidinium_carterae.1
MRRSNTTAPKIAETRRHKVNTRPTCAVKQEALGDFMWDSVGGIHNASLSLRRRSRSCWSEFELAYIEVSNK